MEEDSTILVFGGYGDTGNVFCRYLLQKTAVAVIVCGRRIEKARELVDKLQRDFPSRPISARYADATDSESLRQAFQGVDLVLVAAATTKWAEQVAQAALECGVDYLDIYYDQKVYPVLAKMRGRIEQAGRCFITQAGFHPGLPAAYVRKGAQCFDRYEKANVATAMNVRIERGESLSELIEAMADYKPRFFRDGQWRVASYMDFLEFDFGEPFGVRKCAPLEMKEIEPLPEMFGLQEVGVFASGFNWFVDWLVFPFLILSQKIRKGWLREFWVRTLAWGINRFSSAEQGIVFILEAEGEKDGRSIKLRIFSKHSSAFDFTVIPVIACLKQYFDGAIRKPGLWMMGHLVDPDRLLEDMEKMGVRIQILLTDGEANLVNRS